MELSIQQHEDAWQKSDVPMALVRLDHRFSRCNRAYCKMLGYSESELKLRRWQDVTFPDDIPGDEDSANSLKSSDSDGYTLIKSYITKDRLILGVRLSVLAIRNDNGELLGYFIAALPINHHAAPPSPAQPFSILDWAVKKPKDAALLGVSLGLLLGRDGITELLKLWLK